MHFWCTAALTFKCNSLTWIRSWGSRWAQEKAAEVAASGESMRLVASSGGQGPLRCFGPLGASALAKD